MLMSFEVYSPFGRFLFSSLDKAKFLSVRSARSTIWKVQYEIYFKLTEIILGNIDYPRAVL